MKKGDPKAIIAAVNGKIVIQDPDGAGILQAMNKKKCEEVLHAQIDRVRHFEKRITELEKTPDEVVIVLVNVDDINGQYLAEPLMPGHNWQQYRDRGEVPFARGLALREGIQNALESFDKEAAEKLRSLRNAVVVVVIDFGVAEVYATSLIQ